LIGVALGMLLSVHLPSIVVAADPPVSNPTVMPRIDEFHPKSMLATTTHELLRAKFPVVDVHTHLKFKLPGGAKDLQGFTEVMDRNQIAICIDLDGRLEELADAQRRLLWDQHSERFVIFTHIQWGSPPGEPDVNAACHKPDFVRNVVEYLREAKKIGVSGVKIFKEFGLGVRYSDGTLVRIDDTRWDPIWEACGELGLPVLIHSADPVAFFQPIDLNNERFEELSRHPDWHFPAGKFPSFKELIEARNRVVERHPRTLFIAAHVASNAEDLRAVGTWLDRFPNMYVDIASRISELGRQPYSAKAFMEKYADRILFGSDGPWPETRIRLYWRFLETMDEYFPYSEKAIPPQGLWNIYGLGLDDHTLRKVYYQNAARIIPGVKERLQTRYPELEFAN
jgi:predicted TIM-barrel fold metal-dependent hydrolase